MIKLIKKDLKTIITILVLAAIFISLAPLSGYNFFLVGLLTSACITATFVVCWDLLNGYTGMLNFGQLLFAGVAAYTCALLETNFTIPRPVIMLSALIVGTLSSLLLGLPSLRVKSSYFALISCVLPLVFLKITMTFISIFGGDFGISVPRAFSRESLYFASVVILAIVMIGFRLLTRSRVGIALQCIKGDEDTARAVGISVPKYKLVACLVSAFFTSLAGICMFYSMGHIGPEIFSMHGSFNIAIIGILGGTGTIFGAALGGAFLSILMEFMRPIAEYRILVYALLLVFVVMLFPKGLWGGLTSLLHSIFAKSKN
jgi:branched-chain amino acid transport system permease protein